MPEEDRPYEKCIDKGSASLTDAELLAVILRSGTKGRNSLELAEDILDKCRFEKGLTGLLHLGTAELMELPGIGKVKAVQIVCICELSKRISGRLARRRLDFDRPSSVAEYYMERLRHEEQEVVICMMLDTRSRLIGEKEISRGTVSCSLVSAREIFISALSFHAVSIILIHNHPSGVPEPSSEDRFLTKRLGEAGKLIGIGLLDHIIIGDRTYFSFLEGGLMKCLYEEGSN